MAVNLRLKQLRKEKNLTQTDIANSLGITRERYGLYEAGKRQIGLELLDKVADFYSVSVDYVIGRVDSTEPVFTSEEKQLLDIYRTLDERGRKTVLSSAETQKQLS